jgi:hypothetical protein
MSDDNNKFKNGKIYTIRNRNDETLIYVGSTVQPLYKRLSQHKKDSKNPRYENILLYKKMNETDINDWFIELFEDYPCERKEILNKREGEVIREIGTLNKQIAGRTDKEYRTDNKELIKEHNKKYNENNKDKISEQNKKKYSKNKEHISEKAKERYFTNKEHILEKTKERYFTNKEHISEKAKEKYLKKKLEKEEANIITIS